MQDRLPPARRTLLQRTAGPYIWVMSDRFRVFVDVHFSPEGDQTTASRSGTRAPEWSPPRRGCLFDQSVQKSWLHAELIDQALQLNPGSRIAALMALGKNQFVFQRMFEASELCHAYLISI